MQLLRPAIRQYQWGSTTLIPELAGQNATGEHIAELWFGAHPAAPAHVEQPQDDEEKRATLGATTDSHASSLDQVIAADPEYHLGARVCRSADSRLPFMVKLLAADEPLSLQAHPSKSAAEEGFARENAAGLALDDPQRNYKDANHKPELIVALTPFRALAGFRSNDDTRQLFDAVDCAELRPFMAMLSSSTGTEAERLHQLFRSWVTCSADERSALISAIVDRAHAVLADASPVPSWIADSLRTVIDLQQRYPGDIGVLGAMLLHHVSMEPGEALCLESGQLHAYLEGMGVEIMANSDNVLRGGLTAKHVDVPELLSVLDFSSVDDPVVQAEEIAQGRFRYPARAEEFFLERVELDAAQPSFSISHDGPVIVLVTRGTVLCRQQEWHPAEAMWLPAGNERVDEGDAAASACEISLGESANDAGAGVNAEIFIARA